MFALVINGTVVLTSTTVTMPDLPGWVDCGAQTPDPGATYDGATFTPHPPTAAQVALQQLQANDTIMFRALELLIDVLLAKGAIVASDFTPAVRTLYLARKPLRVTAGVP